LRPRHAEFPVQAAFKDTGVVCIQREGHAFFKQNTHGMLLERCHRTGFYVAGDADFEGNLFRPQKAHQIGVVGSANAVANPLRSNRERRTNRLRPVCFPGVSGQMQARVFGIPVGVAETCRGPASFVATHPE
jgi:hypothetical protein